MENYSEYKMSDKSNEHFNSGLRLECVIKIIINFVVSQAKHIFCVLNRTVSWRQFFSAHKAYVSTNE